MSRLLEFARKELEMAGYDITTPITEINSDYDYVNACAINAYEMLKVFVDTEHSGFSSRITLQLFDKLARVKNLTPLTNNPDEWCDISQYSLESSNTVYQSTRNPACFSEDNLKTYYDIDEDCNYTEVQGEGEVYKVHKPKPLWKSHKIQQVVED